MGRNRTEEFTIDTLRDNEQTQRSVLDVAAVHWSDIFASSEYIIPDYQRNYSWEEEHQEEFWDTILESYDEVERLPEEDDYELDAPAGAYMGTVYFARKNADNDDQQNTFEIVDGQQRLATIQLILTVLYDYIQFYHDGDGRDNVSPTVFSSLVTAKEHLDSAFDNDGNPTVKLAAGDSDYFSALAAKPELGRRTPARVEFVENRLEQDEDIDGQNAPRAKQIKDIVKIFERSNKYNPSSRSLEDSLIAELEPERDEEDEVEDESDNDEEEATEFSRRDEWIRYETSHERLVELYERCYTKIEVATDDLDTDEKVYYIANLAEFVLNGLTVSRCVIEVPDSTLHMDIFKSINDKGLDLHPIDLIRARIRHSLAGASPGAVVSDWNNMLSMFGGKKDKVEDMLGYYVAVRAESIGSKSDANNILLDYFDRRNRNSQIEAQLSGSETDIQNTVDEVLDYADYYHSMVYGDGERLGQLDDTISSECKRDLQAILKRIEDHIGAEQYRSLGGYVCWKVSNESRIEQSNAEEFLRKVFSGIEALILRQSISERSGAATEGVFVDVTDKFASRLDKLNDGDIVVDTAYDPETIVEELQTTAESTVPGLFGRRMVRYVVSNSNWHNSQVRAVFHRMTEQQLRSGDIELEVRNVGELDVEHVFPRHPISDEGGRTELSGEVSEYAWLKYFFNGPDTDNSVGTAVDELINHGVDDLTTEAVEDLDLDDQREQSDLEDAVTHIRKQFINDIGNFIFLTKSDDRSIQNKLFSKKLPVYVYDDYGQLPTNRFFVDDDDDGFNIFNDIAGIEKEDIPEDGLDSMTEDKIEIIDKAWNYERLFERKRSLIPQILAALEFNTGDREFALEETRDVINEEMETDRDEKLEQPNF